MRTVAPLTLLLLAIQLQCVAVINCSFNINTASINPICTNAAGSITINPISGNSPFAYHWANGSTTSSLQHLAPGQYAVTVTDARGCTATQSVSLAASSRSINLGMAVINDTCISSRGKETVSVSGNGTAPYKYIWSQGGTTSAITGLTAHYYTTTVTDVNGCSATAGASVSNFGTAITITGSAVSPACFAGTGSITINAGGGAGGSYSYLWSNGSTSQNPTALPAGNYQVTVTGAYACTATHAYTITRPDSIRLTYSVTALKCDSAKGGAITNTAVSGANYPYTYAWTGPNGFSSTVANLNHLFAGNYHLVLTDSKGCSAIRNFNVDSTGSIGLNYNVANIQCPGANNGAISFAQLNPYSQLATYNWSGIKNFTSSAQSVSNLAPGGYAVTVTESFGCKAVKNYTVTEGFDVGVSVIKNFNVPAPGKAFIIHPVAGDLSQLNGNHCAAGINGKVQLVFSGPAHFTGVTAGALAPTKISGDTLTWNIADFGNLRIDSSFFVCMMTDSSADLSSQVCFTFTVTPLSGDYNTSNNIGEYCMTVVRCYDPNQVQVVPDGNIENTQKYLTYTVLFQNTGTAPAQNVVVLDTLDSHIDATSIKVLASSHTVQTVLNGNAVKFNFRDINLPDSGNDPAGSHGWVQYLVRLNDNLPVGTEINAGASIVFDFNAPVATNTTLNKVVAGINTAVAEPIKEDNSLEVYPNPAHGKISINVGNDAIGGNIEIVDAAGRKCFGAGINANTFNLSISNFAAGVYWVNVVKYSGSIITKKLLIE